MAKARGGKAADQAIFMSDDADAREAELVDRLVASASGLPRVCALKRCRRRKRCLGAMVGGALPCKRHHEGLARARFRSALARLSWPRRD